MPINVDWNKIEHAEAFVEAAVGLGVKSWNVIRGLLTDAGADDQTIQLLQAKWDKLHADVERAAGGTSTASADGTPAPGSAIHDATVAAVKDQIAATNTVEGLDALEAAEKANPNTTGGRMGILTAIAKRRASLSAG